MKLPILKSKGPWKKGKKEHIKIMEEKLPIDIFETWLKRNHPNEWQRREDKLNVEAMDEHSEKMHKN